MLSIFVIWFVTAILVYEATLRLYHPKEIKAQVMLGTAVLGLFFNLIQMKVLHSGEGHYHLGGEGCAGHDHDYDHSHEGHDHSNGHVHGKGCSHSHAKKEEVYEPAHIGNCFHAKNEEKQEHIHWASCSHSKK